MKIWPHLQLRVAHGRATMGLYTLVMSSRAQCGHIVSTQNSRIHHSHTARTVNDALKKVGQKATAQ